MTSQPPNTPAIGGTPPKIPGNSGRVTGAGVVQVQASASQANEESTPMWTEAKYQEGLNVAHFAYQ